MGFKKRLMFTIAAIVIALSALHAAAAATGEGVANPPVRACSSFGQLKAGDSGAGVQALQDALRSEGLYNGGDSYGYFGAYTASAVTGFQQRYSSDILDSRGLAYGTGYVDRETAEKLNEIYGCETDQAPVIYGVSGPTGLKAGETGTWSVRAGDPDGGQLSYYVSWGDAHDAPISGNGKTYEDSAQEATFTHSYANAGTYTVTFTVRDAQGLSARSTISVSVSGSHSGTGSARITAINSDTPCTLMQCADNDAGCVRRCGVMYNASVSLYRADAPYEYAVMNAASTIAPDAMPWPGTFIGTRDTGSGAALFYGLAPGSYMASVSSNGYSTSTVWITVEDNSQAYATAYLSHWMPLKYMQGRAGGHDDVAVTAGGPAGYIVQAVMGMMG